MPLSQRGLERETLHSAVTRLMNPQMKLLVSQKYLRSGLMRQSKSKPLVTELIVVLGVLYQMCTVVVNSFENDTNINFHKV